MSSDDVGLLAEVSPLRRELFETQAQLAEALEALDAIRNGEVDAVLVGGPHNREIYTLESADRSYRLLIEQMTEGAIMLSPDDTVLYSNRALAEMLDAPATRIVGGPLERFVAAKSQGRFRSLLSKGGRAEIRLKRGAGAETFRAQISLTPVTASGAEFLCGVVTDLTLTYAQAREASEARSLAAVQAARRESDERYRLILEGVTDYAIIATDLDQNVTIWNSGAQTILGWETSELLGKPFPKIWTAADLAAGAPDGESAHSLASGRVEEERWHCRKGGAAFWAHSLMVPLRQDDGRHIGFLRILRDRTEQRAADERQTLLINELNHRVKNTLATVQSIAAQTLRSAPTTQVGLSALDERLTALSRAHDVLTRESWEGAELGEIVALAVAPYRGNTSAHIDTRGPNVRLRPNVALAMAMALQELATNAAKYGALSTPEGRLSITWLMADDCLSLRWQERDGPVVIPPLKRGFGSRLIERSLAAELGGDVVIDFAPGGVICDISVALIEADQPANAATQASGAQEAQLGPAASEERLVRQGGDDS